MNLKLRKSYFLYFSFFFVYFLTYIGEMTSIKYLGIVLFQVYLLINYKKFEFKYLDKGIFNTLALLSACLLISLFMNFNPGGAIKTLSLIDLFILSHTFLSRTTNKLGINKDNLLSIIANSLFLVLIIAFVTQYNDTVVAIGRSTGTVVRHRFGTGAESIVGFLCFIEFTLAFYIAYSRRLNKQRIILQACQCILSIYMAYLASIRASLVSMIFFVIMLFYNKLPRSRTTALLKTVIFFMSFMAIIILSSSVTINIDTLNYIFSSRFVYYERAITEVISSGSILFGLGSFRNSVVADMNKVQVDNSFIDIFYQYGIICLLVVSSLLIIIENKLRRISARATQNKNYDHFINAYFITVLLYSMGEKNLFSLSSALGLVTFIMVFHYIENYKSFLCKDMGEK